ncbi:gag-pol polyprotein, partial [Lasius niger]
ITISSSATLAVVEECPLFKLAELADKIMDQSRLLKLNILEVDLSLDIKKKDIDQRQEIKLMKMIRKFASTIENLVQKLLNVQYLAICPNQFRKGKLAAPLNCEANDNGPHNNRLIVFDKSSGLNFLIDTGADVSLIPKELVSKAQVSSFKLYAANGTKINTYGSKTLILNFGLRRVFKWKFCVANLQKPILGADFLSHYIILVDIKNKRLLNSVTGLSFKGKLSKVNHLTVCTTFPDSPFHKILAEFPELTRFTPISATKIHQVEHRIVTKGPIASTPRRLSPEKLKFARNEFNFMVEQDICRPSSSTWAAPLHMVPKNKLLETLRRLPSFKCSHYSRSEEIPFLGYLVSKQGIKPTSEKVKAIIDYKKPKSIHELRRFIGIINFYRRCLKNAASHQTVLTNYLKETVKHFRYMLERRQILIRTDHKPLIYAFQQKLDKASPRQICYLDFIAQFSTNIEHISGKDNVAHSLSKIEAVSMP